MKTLIIIPAYNEEKTIKKVIEKCLKYGKVLVVNDGSSDNTLKEIKKTKALYINNRENRGKGYCLRKGFNYAIKKGFDVAITLDADGQHDPAYIPRFLEEIKKGKDIVIGTRKKRHSSMPYQRRLSNFVLSFIISIFARKWIKDTQSGYRAYKVEILKNIKLKTSRYETESEILMKLGRKKVVFGEVRIPTIYGDEKSKIHPLKDAFRMVKVLKYRK